MKKYAIQITYHFSGLNSESFYYLSTGCKTKSIYLAKHFLTKFGAKLWLKRNYYKVQRVFAYNSLTLVKVFPMKYLSEERQAEELHIIKEEIKENFKSEDKSK